MKIEIDPVLIAQLIEALKDPHFARNVALVGTIGILGWMLVRS